MRTVLSFTAIMCTQLHAQTHAHKQLLKVSCCLFKFWLFSVFDFYTCDAVLALCLSVTSQCFIETAEQIKLVFGMGASFYLSCTVLKGNSGISKNKGTSLLNCGLWKFRRGVSIVETCYQLSLRKVDAQSVINWTITGQLSWQYLWALTLDCCSLLQ